MSSNNSTRTLIRFSTSWWIYMVARGGILRSVVNGVEDALAITGRNLLLFYLIYCGAKAGAFLVAPDMAFPVWLEMFMFVLQLGGLEGSMPGLARQVDALQAQQQDDAAKRINKVMLSARVLTVASMAEGALHSLNFMGDGTKYISAVLLVVRGVVITGFLIELAKIQAESPRVLSKTEHERELERDALEGEQARTITDLRIQVEQLQVTLVQAREAVQQAESGQSEVIEQLRAKVVQMGLDHKGALDLVREQAGQREESQSTLIQGLRETIASMEEVQKVATASVDGQTQIVTNLQNRLGSAERQVTDLTAKLGESERKFAGVSADLQTAKRTIGDLQNVANEATNLTARLEEKERELASVVTDLQSAKTKIADLQAAKSRSAKSSDQSANTSKITPIETAKSNRISHAEVIAYMDANPTLKRAEVAANLSISERKVYDAIAWRKDQENAVAEA